ncbi:hypothetical protein [Chroococcus sp. FPU101]|uniref:hypothetical protein n=1 Tax=Chroococcus sp. FPU101 TaxID=1974212 RepID=UPI001A8C0301|nr:hypothetical protein [Chroococcus sp. FPU101]GFE67878.1 hypothetical protein CFPU101_04880 [Chroococcus sp. FPU101]
MNNSSPENANHTDHSPSSNTQDEVVSIVPHSPQTAHLDRLNNEEAYAIFESSRPNYDQDRLLWLESLLTPWGLGSILLILLSNSILSWATWSESYSKQTPEPVIASASAKIEPPVNSSATESNAVSISVPISPPTPPQAVNIPQPPVKPVATVKPKTDLTSALLTPSVRPQFMEVKTITKPHSPTVLVKTVPTSVKKATLPPRKATKPVAVVQITKLPPPPTTQPVVAQNRPLPPAPTTQPADIQLPTSNTDTSKTRTANERLLEEKRLREQPTSNITFFQKVKTQQQAIQTRQSLNQVLEKIEQQPQTRPQQQLQSELQTQKVESQPQQIQTPAIPNTLIIDGKNPENNTNR